MSWHDEIVRLQAIFQPLLWRIPFALVILAMGFLLAYLTGVALAVLLRGQDRRNAFFYPWIARIALLLATVSLALLALGVAGPVIGFIVSFSVALGFVADSFGGLRILLLKPFNIGDTIELKGDGFIGFVEQFSLLGTVLLTPERSRVFIPNRQLFEHPIVNHSNPDTKKMALFEFVLEPPPTMDNLEELLEHMIKDPESGHSGEVFVTRVDAATVTLKIKLETNAWLRERTASAFLRHAETELKAHQVKIHSLTLLDNS